MKHWLFKFSFLMVSLLVGGCFSSSPQECRRSAEGQVKLLLSDLKKVETKEDLMREGRNIEKKMHLLVDLMIQIHKLEHGHAKNREESPLSLLLLEEFKRIYQIEGARQLIESYQREALLKLDSYDQSI